MIGTRKASGTCLSTKKRHQRSSTCPSALPNNPYLVLVGRRVAGGGQKKVILLNKFGNDVSYAVFSMSVTEGQRQIG